MKADPRKSTAGAESTEGGDVPPPRPRAQRTEPPRQQARRGGLENLFGGGGFGGGGLGGGRFGGVHFGYGFGQFVGGSL